MNGRSMRGLALARQGDVDSYSPCPAGRARTVLSPSFRGLLDGRNYFFPPERKGATQQTLRNLLTKPGWNSLEVRTFRGVLSAFKDRRPD
jgi:tRNA/rRNA methyltransferase